MNRRKMILLPGLDGTGKLFAPLIDALPGFIEPRIASYPNEVIESYDELVEFVQGANSTNEPFVLVAESFSGPLAIKFAAANADKVDALILCATFVENPLPKLAGWLKGLVRPLFFKLSPPHFLLRYLLLGKHCPQALVEQLSEIVKSQNPSVVASRIRLVLSADERESLKVCDLPILYLAARRDKLVSARSVQTILSLNSRAKKVEIDAPHLLFQCKPEEAANAITRFLQHELQG